MRNNPILFFLIFSTIIFLIDFYTYRGLKKLIGKLNKNTKRILKLLLWIVPFILILSMVLIPFLRDKINPAHFLIYIHFISGTFILFYIPKLIFIIFNLIDDLIHLSVKTFTKDKKENKSQSDLKKISRSQFLTRIGILTAGVPFLSIAYGIGWGRFNTTVRREILSFVNLPHKFNGLRIVQLSDFHLGSLLNHSSFVDEVVETVNSLNPDLILFTGDIVNNVSEEMDKFVPKLGRLNSRFGKYSVLGNHDYGEYVPWKSDEDKLENLNKIKQKQIDSGFDLILNDSRKINLEGEEIALIGVENWGLPPFPQYGELDRAMSNIEEDSFKILMSHDPTHWDAQVLGSTNIDLTLSGHTHGAQFGVEIPGWRWSPVNVRYKRWGGLYTEGSQHIYVNTGIGFIGFPGRVGMPPEITLIELKRV